MRLTTDFRHQLSEYQVYSFYEMKPMKTLSTLVSSKVVLSIGVSWANVVMYQVVERHSALLDVHAEERIPVHADHEEMCKFGERDDETYEKLFKRIRKMIKVSAIFASVYIIKMLISCWNIRPAISQ